MHIRRLVVAFAIGTIVVVGCQTPSGESTNEPAGSPVAPAVEPTHPRAEETIPLPSGAPVAPAVEPEPSGPDTPIRTLPSGAPIAPAIEPEPNGPEPTIEFDPG